MQRAAAFPDPRRLRAGRACGPCGRAQAARRSGWRGGRRDSQATALSGGAGAGDPLQDGAQGSPASGRNKPFSPRVAEHAGRTGLPHGLVQRSRARGMPAACLDPEKAPRAPVERPLPRAGPSRKRSADCCAQGQRPPPARPKCRCFSNPQQCSARQRVIPPPPPSSPTAAARHGKISRCVVCRGLTL